MEKNSSNSRNNFDDRRKQADWVVKMATILSVASWLTAMVVSIMIDQASPMRTTFIGNVWGESGVRTYWDTSLLPYALTFLIIAFCCCVGAFIFNAMRMRRKSDRFRKSIIITGVLTLIAIFIFIANFAPVLFN